MDGSRALGAGLLLIAVTAILAVAGVLVGSAFELRLIGGLLGGAIGVVTGFVAVHRIFMRSLDEADRQQDYSTIRPLDDDDDDRW